MPEKLVDGVPKGWTLKIEETSAGVYQTQLTAEFGSVVELRGTDVEELVKRSIESALAIEAQIGLH